MADDDSNIEVTTNLNDYHHAAGQAQSLINGYRIGELEKRVDKIETSIQNNTRATIATLISVVVSGVGVLFTHLFIPGATR